MYSESKTGKARTFLASWFLEKDGILFWKQAPCTWVYAGDVAGSQRADGYVEVGFQGKSYLRHRIIFLLHHGYLPTLVDHINQIPGDDRIENLRDANKRLNSYNSKLFKNNKSGTRGVSWDKKQGKWTVRFKEKDKYLFCGYFASLEDAVTKRLDMEKKGGI